MKYKLLIIFILTLHVGFAQTGIKAIINHQDLNGKNTQNNEKSSFTILGDLLRIDAANVLGNQSIIFKEKEEKLWILNHNDKTFSIVTKDQIEAVKKQMEETSKMIQEQLSYFSDSQRDIMENQFGPAKKPKFNYKPTKETTKINRWKCKKFEGYKKEVLSHYLWVTSLKNLGIKEPDLNVLKTFSSLVESVGYGMGGPEEILFSLNEGYEGLPVKTIRLKNGKENYIETLESIKKTKVDKTVFNIPSGYTESKNPLFHSDY